MEDKMKFADKKVYLFFSILYLFYGCSQSTGNSDQINNPQSPTSNSSSTDVNTIKTFFASGRFKNDFVLSSIMGFHYSTATNTFSEPFSLQDPFGNIENLDHSYTRKVTCQGNTCIAIGGYNFTQNILFSNCNPRCGDYGGTIFLSNNYGVNWSSQSTPFEISNPEPSDSAFHSSVNDAACIGDKCIVVGLYGEHDSITHTHDHPQIGYNSHASINPTDWNVSEGPLAVGTDISSSGIPGIVEASYLSRVYCYNSSKCFSLGWFSNSYFGNFLHGVSFILKSDDMINWSWNNTVYPNPANFLPDYSELKDISCLDANNCYAIGKYFQDYNQVSRKTLLLSTSNGGLSWSEDTSNMSQLIFAARSSASQHDYSIYDYGLGISCAPEGTTCFAIAGYHTVSADTSPFADYGIILKGVKNSSTGQLEWSALAMPSVFVNPYYDYATIMFTGIHCYNDNVCMLSGQYLRTQDSTNSINVHDNARIGQKTGFTLSTTDGGLSWTRKSTEFIPSYQNSIWSLLTDISM